MAVLSTGWSVESSNWVTNTDSGPVYHSRIESLEWYPSFGSVGLTRSSHCIYDSACHDTTSSQRNTALRHEQILTRLDPTLGISAMALLDKVQNVKDTPCLWQTLPLQEIDLTVQARVRYTRRRRGCFDPDEPVATFWLKKWRPDRGYCVLSHASKSSYVNMRINGFTLHDLQSTCPRLIFGLDV